MAKSRGAQPSSSSGDSDSDGSGNSSSSNSSSSSSASGAITVESHGAQKVASSSSSQHGSGRGNRATRVTQHSGGSGGSRSASSTATLKSGSTLPVGSSSKEKRSGDGGGGGNVGSFVELKGQLVKIISAHCENQSGRRRGVLELRKLHHLQQSRNILNFHAAFWECMLHILKVRKGNAQIDKGALKFLEAYFKDLSESDGESSRDAGIKLMDYIIRQSVNGFNSKSSVVRFRVCQLITLVLNHLDEIDDDMHEILQSNLLQRIRDKEASVRLHAGLALSRFQGSPEDPAEEILDVIIQTMEGDPSAEVRKGLLWNVEIFDRSLNALLLRCNDCEPSVRKMVYHKFSVQGNGALALPPQSRDIMISTGLRDRDPSVVKKCENMVLSWTNQLKCTTSEVLKRLEITFGASAEPVAEILLQHELYSASFKGISLNSTPEDILVCRVGAKISFEKKQEDKLQSFLPCLIDHAELLDAQLAVLQESGTDDSGGIQLLHAEFKLRQLLLLAHYQDYSDEAGRRRMVETLRRIIVFDDLAPENLCLCSKGLLPACGVDEFERTVAEIITEIEDMTTEQPASMSGGVDWKDLAFLQALEIIRAYLEVLPQGTRRSSSFDYILHRFVLPAVRSANATLRTAGINCLSLACSSDKTLANENHALYLHLIQNKSKELQKISLQTVFDLTMLHGEQIFGLDTIVQIIKFGLGSSDPDVLTLIVEGSCKLIICKAVDDHEILEALAILLFHPGTRGHQRLRQCLSFFFPLFLLSSNANQCTFSKVVPACLMSLISAYEDVETEDGLTLALIAGQLFEWTDWRHLERLQPGDAMTADTDINKNLHADIGIDLISKLQTRPAILKEGAKLLSLLSLDKEVSHASLERLLDAAQDLVEHQSPDAPTLKLLGRFTDKLEALL